LRPEYSNLESISASTNDPYILSLIAGAFYNVGQDEKAKAIADRLIPMQNS